jgi:membrane-associated phospholipid phosphatase
MKDFIGTMPRIIKKLYMGKHLLWQMLAFLLTYIVVVTGFDWLYFTSVRNESLNEVFFPALAGGFLIPIILPIALILISMWTGRKKLSTLGWALGQAALLGWLVSSLYKAFTGRVQPDLVNLAVDSSRQFNFGIFEHGIFWGWPSSHTTVAFALAFASLSLLSAQRKHLRMVVLFCALYVGIGVSLSIHWFSEFIAGAIIGAVIGNVVGEEWKGEV